MPLPDNVLPDRGELDWDVTMDNAWDILRGVITELEGDIDARALVGHVHAAADIDTAATSLTNNTASSFRQALNTVFGSMISGQVVASGTVTVTEGAAWAVGVTVTNGVAQFNFTVPPAGVAWSKTATPLASNTNVGTLTAGIYRVGNGTVATDLGLPILDVSALTVVAMSSSPTNYSALVEQWGYDGAGGVVVFQAWRGPTGIIGPWRQVGKVQSRILNANENATRLGSGLYGVLADRFILTLPKSVSGVLTEGVVGDSAWAQMFQEWTTSGDIDLLVRSMSTTYQQTWQRPESPRATAYTQAELSAAIAALSDVRADGSVPSSAWSVAPATIPMLVPTPDGTGQATHPSVVDVPAGWNGRRYWMAYTPYAWANDALEDPIVAWSDNGAAWTAATGAFPLDDAPGGNDFNSDTNLVLHNGTMYAIWRRSTDAGTKVWYRTSTNGTTWTTKAQLWDPAGMSAFSPSLVKTPTGWRMWFIGGAAGARKLAYQDTTSASPDSGWGATTYATTPLPAGREPWHVEIFLLGGRWWGLLTDTTTGLNGVNCEVRLMQSADGIDWDVSPTQLIPKLGHSHDSLYKATGTFTGSALKPTISVWYSGLSADKGWWLYRGGAVTLNEPRLPARASATDIAALSARLTTTEYNTGWRSIPIPIGGTSLLDGTGEIHVRRRGTSPDTDMVDVRLIGVGVLPGATLGAYLTATAGIPVGFTGWYSERNRFLIGSSNAASEYWIGVQQTGRLVLGKTGSIPGTGNASLQGTITYPAAGSRPVVLPGTASTGGL